MLGSFVVQPRVETWIAAPQYSGSKNGGQAWDSYWTNVRPNGSQCNLMSNPVVQYHLRINIVAQIKGKPNNKVYRGIETKYLNEQSSLLFYSCNLVQQYRSATAEAINIM